MAGMAENAKKSFKVVQGNEKAFVPDAGSVQVKVNHQ